ncbi:MAG TPA: GGDEF domain-containing protein [Ramlibacter sp.]|nr:GGDEF domain-containing protein [Ramlibacter sp.]
MDTVAIGFWGAFFGSAALMLAGALAAFARSLQRVALMAALSSLVSALFVVAYLGWLPITDPAVQARLLAHVAVLAAVMLGLMLLAMLGLLRDRATAGTARAGMIGAAGAVLGAGWLLDAAGSLVLGSLMAFTVGAVMLVICIGMAQRGDRLAWVAVSGVSFMLVAVGGLSWIALHRAEAPWQVHVASATAAIAYLASMAAALWTRYSYLIELREAVAHGPSYDPVTRMRSHAETGQMVGLAFFGHQDDATLPIGVIAVSIGNLYTLENLHGRSALNHALFVCAGRLRSCVPSNVEMGRLAEDGFLLLVRGSSPERMVELARLLARRLSRPVALSTSPGDVENRQAPWVAQVGVGLLATTAQVRPSVAVSMARAMSRTAWSYPSRLAWHDDASGKIAELPATDVA